MHKNCVSYIVQVRSYESLNVVKKYYLHFFVEMDLTVSL